MELAEFIAIINPWINSMASMIMFVFAAFIVAKLSNRIVNKILNLFNIKNVAEAKLKTFFNIIPDITEYIIYVIAFALILRYFGFFNLAVIVLVISIASIIVLWLILEIFSFIPNIIARNKLYKKSKEITQICNEYKIGLVSTEFQLGNKEYLYYKNKNLLKNLKP